MATIINIVLLVTLETVGFQKGDFVQPYSDFFFLTWDVVVFFPLESEELSIRVF